MGNTIKSFGDQAARGINYIDKNITPVSYYYWIVPALIAWVLTMIIIKFINPPLSGTHKGTVCTGEGANQHCEEKDINNKYNILWYIILPIIIGSISGGIVYKLAFELKNPKFAAGVMGVEMIEGLI